MPLIVKEKCRLKINLFCVKLVIFVDVKNRMHFYQELYDSLHLENRFYYMLGVIEQSQILVYLAVSSIIFH